MTTDLFKAMAQSIIDGDAEVAEQLARQAIEQPLRVNGPARSCDADRDAFFVDQSSVLPTGTALSSLNPSLTINRERLPRQSRSRMSNS